MGRRREELGNKITVLPDENHMTRMGSTVALQESTPEAEASLHPNPVREKNNPISTFK